METRALLESLPFQEDYWTLTDRQPGYFYDFGNFRLEAVQLTNQYFRQVFVFSGVIANTRSLRMINFQLPVEVESFEQGVALIAHGLGADFVPDVPTSWLTDGRSWASHLPGVRERIAYSARPHCVVEKDWFRVALRKLLDIGGSTEADALVSIGFDGEVLRFSCNGKVVICPATGSSWDETYSIRATQLEHLPKRLRDWVDVSIWKDRLTIGNRVWYLEPQPDTESLPRV
ncbi:hypothetical protein [Pseudomonas sp. G(2018)]|uniref:hypothetical protein n=1 Tax=Pseudomonas sp. G(2018) TaxID=2502242 RepID=UPI0010F7D9E0|nr:hypothetical protein [Pseudomonas sp. G(2018)]